jgi:hypothetical protein
MAVSAALAAMMLAVPVTAQMRAKPGIIQIEGLTVRVHSNDRLAYRITAEAGQMEEESQIVELTRPDVEIYDENREIKQQVAGWRGKLWPVKIQTEQPDGQTKETTKYDWSLAGDVLFEGADGSRVQALEMHFHNESQSVTATTGVQFRMAAGEGSMLSGSADEFEAQIDPATGGINRWVLTGNVTLTAEAVEDEP